MKIFLFLILMIIFPYPVNAHPGHLDSNNGHKCFSNCDQYGLKYGQYHSHSGHNGYNGPLGPRKAIAPKNDPPLWGKVAGQIFIWGMILFVVLMYIGPLFKK